MTRFLLLTFALPTLAAPVLHSRPGAPATLYLDFAGDPLDHNTPAWGTDAQHADVWTRVADKYSPFNLDVTTEDPGALVQRKVMRVLIGGAGAWTGDVIGGQSTINGFGGLFSAGRTAYVFPTNLSNDAKYVGEAAAHEAGHVFGLSHQVVLDATGKNIANPYNPGNNLTAPIMGVSYYAVRGLWWDGTTPNTPSTGFLQDDLAEIARPVNGFGYAPDGPGVIEQAADTDAFPVTGPATVTVTSGGMLDLKLDVWDSTGRLAQTVDTTSLGERVTLPAGDWSVGVAGDGTYGDVGGYAVAVTPVGEPGAALLVCGMAMVGCGRRRALAVARADHQHGGANGDAADAVVVYVDDGCAGVKSTTVPAVVLFRRHGHVIVKVRDESLEFSDRHGRDCSTPLSQRQRRQSNPRPSSQGTRFTPATVINRPATAAAAFASVASTYSSTSTSFSPAPSSRTPQAL